MRLVLPLMYCLAFFGPLKSLAQEVSWAVVRQQVRTAFPEVRQLSTDTLAARLERGEVPMLLDVRTEAEYAVSHLPGARHLDPEAAAEALAGVPKDAPLVTYCSVGYRSSEMARRLQAAGFTNVANLEGSLFQWANEGRRVVRDGGTVRQVHPYDEVWGRLLKKDLRAYPPR